MKKSFGMKRGIIRIITGTVMILLQIVSIIGQSSTEGSASSDVFYNLGFNIGLYSVGIVGIILLVFGISAYHRGLRSQLILHTGSRKLHTVVKWIAFVITTLFFVCYLISFLQYRSDFGISVILMIFGTLSFALYLLLYLFKKPSCLFSTTLVFVGVSYLYGLIGNMTFYLLYLPDMDNYIIFVILGIIPSLITSVLYIIIASKLYKEKFSVKSIRVMGWIAFGLEFSNKVLCQILIGNSYYFNNLENLLGILFTTALFLYISVFRINTLQEVSVEETLNEVRFCHKCGNQLISGSAFCEQCGTEIIRK